MKTIEGTVVRSTEVVEAEAPLPENTAYKLIVTTIPRVIGDIKTICKTLTPEGKPWPPEMREMLRYIRELSDSLEEKHPHIRR